ncbi:hypothetical protein O181_108908, partial [Austropuccinia psidii MF-1]|nr:hypothetical protein [Austropuccinia psidii MF-1]
NSLVLSIGKLFYMSCATYEELLSKVLCTLREGGKVCSLTATLIGGTVVKPDGLSLGLWSISTIA